VLDIPRTASYRAAAAAVLVLAAAGCGGSASPAKTTAGPGTQPATAETNPSGDIPDNVAYVAYQPPSGHYTVKTPEGWSREAAGDQVRFTDKLNRVQVMLRPLAAAPTVTSVRAQELPAAMGSTSGAGGLGAVTTAARSAGQAIVARYQANSPAEPVTGKVVRDAVERSSCWKPGTEAVLPLSGPVGADNVDPYKMITDSFRWRP